MKILFLSAANSIHTVRWVNGLAKRGHKVLLVSEKNHMAATDSVSKKVKILYLPVEGKKGYYLNAFFLRKIYVKFQPDVVNVHYASGYGTLARIAKLPYVFLSVWGSDVYDFPYESRIKKRILIKNLEYAFAIGSTSYTMAEQTRKLLRKKKTIKVIPFGIDLCRFYPKTSRNSEKTVYGIVKTLSPKYGIDTVLKAFAVFYKRLPIQEKQKVFLEIYGEGELLHTLKKLAGRLGIGKSVTFGGYVENYEIPEKLNKMDIFVLGSNRNSESFGVAAVEAMSCGLPVIATDVAGFKEVIKDGVTGYLVPVGNVEAMADRMMRLYYDQELRVKMGEKGRQRAEKLYDLEQCLDLMEMTGEKLRNRKMRGMI